MIDFSARPVEKSQEEQEFDLLNEQYEEKFGKPYFFAIGVDSPTWAEAIADIKRRIETGEEQPEPDYESENIY